LRAVAGNAYSTEGTAGAICFSTRDWHDSATNLRFEWGGGDACLQLNVEGSLLSLRVAGSTVALPVTGVLRWMARYTLAWRVADGTMDLCLHGGPADARSVLPASGAYAVGAASALPAGGAALSGQWVHVYALRWWSRPPAAADWAAAVAALDAEWLWQSPTCNVTFDGHNRAAMRMLAAPHSAVVGAWCAQPPHTAAWQLLTRWSRDERDAPVVVTAPRPGVLLGWWSAWLETNAFCGARNSASGVAFSSLPVASRPPDLPGMEFQIALEWYNQDGISLVSVWMNMTNNDPLQVYYSGEPRVQTVLEEPRETDGTGGGLYTIGWRITDGRLDVWYASDATGARRVVARTVPFPRGSKDTHPEPDVSYVVYGYNVVVHEVRLVSPAPSPEAWDASVRDLDKKWAAV
jgi:hypothetical protein